MSAFLVELENNERFILYTHIAINTININALRFRSFCVKDGRYFPMDEIIDQMNRSLFSIILRLTDNHLGEK